MILETDLKVPVREHTSYRDEELGAISKKPPCCPLCEGPTEPAFQKNGYVLRDCQVCSHRFVEIDDAENHVDRVYADGYFGGTTGGYADYLADEELLISNGRRYARVLNRYLEPGTILDVGAAAGFVLKGFEEMGWKGTGIEPNSTMADYARRILDIRVETATLEESQLRGKYDLIAMIQVVAHFVDPRQALGVASEMTKPGGYWLIETWNKESWAARVLGEGWHEYNPPSVLHCFSHESLRKLVESLGMRQIARGRPTKWISRAHARSIATNGPVGGLAGKLIDYGTRIVPGKSAFPYLLDDVFWALYRKP